MMNPNQLFNLTFETAEKLSSPQSLGLDAEICIYPHNADIGSALFSAGFVFYPEIARESMQMSNEEFLEYAKATFFGTGGHAFETKKAEALGTNIEFQVIKKNIPAPGTLQVGIAGLRNGNSVVIGFEWKIEFNDSVAEKMISEILESIREAE